MSRYSITQGNIWQTCFISVLKIPLLVVHKSIMDTQLISSLILSSCRFSPLGTALARLNGLLLLIKAAEARVCGLLATHLTPHISSTAIEQGKKSRFRQHVFVHV